MISNFPVIYIYIYIGAHKEVKQLEILCYQICLIIQIMPRQVAYMLNFEAFIVTLLSLKC
jgi:hypothetical protein